MPLVCDHVCFYLMPVCLLTRLYTLLNVITNIFEFKYTAFICFFYLCHLSRCFYFAFFLLLFCTPAFYLIKVCFKLVCLPFSGQWILKYLNSSYLCVIVFVILILVYFMSLEMLLLLYLFNIILDLSFLLLFIVSCTFMIPSEMFLLSENSFVFCMFF